MAHEFNMLSIFNAALVAQGQQEIVSENDGSDEFRVLARNWPAIVEAELEDGAYFFSRREAVLHNRTPGKFGFTDAFLIPAEAIHIRRVWNPADPRCSIDYVQDGTHIHVNHPQPLTVQYLEVPDEHLWSANFTRGVQMKLEAVILRSLKEEHGEASEMERQAEVYFQRARTNSSKARSATKPHRKGRIAEARFAGSAPDSWQRRAGPAPSYPPTPVDPETPTSDVADTNYVSIYQQAQT